MAPAPTTAIDGFMLPALCDSATRYQSRLRVPIRVTRQQEKYRERAE